MKIVVFLFSIFLLGSIQDKGVKVIYSRSEKLDSNLHLALPNNIKKHRQRKVGQKSESVLEIQGKKSYFYPKNQSVFTRCFKNTTNGQSYMVLDFDIGSKEPYAAKTDFSEFGWVVDRNQTKRILDYTCYRAESTEKKVVAWYTPEINYSEGPYIYGGLDGMILEIDSKGAITTATEIDMNVDISLNFPVKFHLVSMSKLRNRWMNNRK